MEKGLRMNNFHELFFTTPKRYQAISKSKTPAISELFNEINNAITYNSEYSRYKLYEENNNIIYKCLAPSFEEKDLDIKIDNKTLVIKSTIADNEKLDFNCFSDQALKLKKAVDPDTSYAALSQGVLTVTMPIREDLKTSNIKFI